MKSFDERLSSARDLAVSREQDAGMSSFLIAMSFWGGLSTGHMFAVSVRSRFRSWSRFIPEPKRIKLEAMEDDQLATCLRSWLADAIAIGMLDPTDPGVPPKAVGEQHVYPVRKDA